VTEQLLVSPEGFCFKVRSFDGEWSQSVCTFSLPCWTVSVYPRIDVSVLGCVQPAVHPTRQVQLKQYYDLCSEAARPTKPPMMRLTYLLRSGFRDLTVQMIFLLVFWRIIFLCRNTKLNNIILHCVSLAIGILCTSTWYVKLRLCFILSVFQIFKYTSFFGPTGHLHM
jgi:hypothetical protein